MYLSPEERAWARWKGEEAAPTPEPVQPGLQAHVGGAALSEQIQPETISTSNMSWATHPHELGGFGD